jgi:DNA polymerase
METLESLSTHIRACSLCPLSRSRTHAVPGEGVRDAALMFVGEAPGRTEDAQGRPFVGSAGRLLDRLLADLGIRRDEVFLTNVVKCRPPRNRDPHVGEIAACRPYLECELTLIQPKLIVTLGRHALTWFLPGLVLSHVQGELQQRGPYAVFPLYHPAAALRFQDRARAFEAALRRLPAMLRRFA